jgi:hypothetical protein
MNHGKDVKIYFASPINTNPRVRMKTPKIRTFQWLSLKKKTPIRAPKRAPTCRKATT